jgi:hypothetical protein
MIEAGLTALLLGNTAVAAIVGDRVYPLVLPGKPGTEEVRKYVPSVTYQRVSSTRVAGTLQGPSELVGARIQVDAWADSYATVKHLADAIRSAVDGFKGTAGGKDIQGAFLEIDFDQFEPDVRLWRVTQNYRVYHNEVAAA